MIFLLNNLSSQEPVVLRELRRMMGGTRADAIRYWEHSKTKARLEQEQLFYVSGMRIAWELMCEMTNDCRWFDEPFDM